MMISMFFNLSNSSVPKAEGDVIYKDYCDGMKNHSRDHIRSAGNIARSITKGATHSTLASTILNFVQIEPHLENIENNLNKVCVLTKQNK